MPNRGEPAKTVNVGSFTGAPPSHKYLDRDTCGNCNDGSGNNGYDGESEPFTFEYRKAGDESHCCGDEEEREMLQHEITYILYHRQLYYPCQQEE